MIKNLKIAKSPAEAARLKKAGWDYLAGGTEINRLNSAVKVENAVSVADCGLKEIVVKDSGECCSCGASASEKICRIGAAATFTDIIRSGSTPDFLKEACLFCSSFQRRNRATIGGNIALCRDDSYLVPALLAAKTKCCVRTGSKTVCMPLEDLLSGTYYNALIEAVAVNVSGRMVFSKRIANTQASHAVLTVAFGVCRSRETGKPKHPVFIAAIKGTGIVSIGCADAAVEDNPDISPEELEQIVKKCSCISCKSDIYGSAAYKKYLLAVTVADLYKEFLKGGRA